MNRAGRSAAPSREFRAIGAWLLIVFVLGQACAGLHYALERHTVCAAHGAVAHGHAGHDRCLDIESEVSRPSEPVLHAVDEEGGHGEHCAILLFQEQRCDSSVVFGGRPWLAPQLRGGNPPGGAAHRTIELLRLAPKQSPPRSA